MTIRIRKVTFLLQFMLISILGFAQSKQKDLNTQPLSEKIEFFYLNHEPLIAKQIIREIADLNALDNYFYFFVALAKEHPKQLIEWFSEAQVSIEKHPKLIHALHFGGLKGEAIRLAQKANWSTNKILSLGSDIPTFLLMPVAFPGYIPCMCSHFVATGDVRYVKRIIDALETSPILIKDPNELKELKEEAKQKLTSFVFKHDKVYRLCLEEAKTRKGEVAAFLNKLLDELHQSNKNNFKQQQDGMFNGFIFVTEDSYFEEQWEGLPIMSTPVCKQTEAIPYPRENKMIRVFTMFNGMELDKDLNGYVTYDIEIIDPKGNKMSGFHNMHGIHRKVPSRFLLQKADQSVTFEFCPNDKDSKKGKQKIVFSGTYTINAHLKDHVSRKDLNLSTTLKVQPEK
jgi:hypothetical protein